MQKTGLFLIFLDLLVFYGQYYGELVHKTHRFEEFSIHTFVMLKKFNGQRLPGTFSR